MIDDPLIFVKKENEKWQKDLAAAVAAQWAA